MLFNSFLYLFIVDCLDDVLRSDINVQSIRLSNYINSITNQEFANDTNLYLAKTHDNLEQTKTMLLIFSLVAEV